MSERTFTVTLTGTQLQPQAGNGCLQTEANLAVQVWSINTCEDMLRMIDLGVDAIMADRPLPLEKTLSTPALQLWRDK